MKPVVQNPIDPVGTAQVLRRFRVVFNAVRSHFQQVEKQVGRIYFLKINASPLTGKPCFHSRKAQVHTGFERGQAQILFEPVFGRPTQRAPGHLAGRSGRIGTGLWSF